MEDAKRLLRSLGMRATYSGYNYLATAIVLTAENPDYLRSVMKNLYTIVGEQYGVSNRCVESALRTLIVSYWNMDGGSVLSERLNYKIYDRPTSREMIEILADYLREQS